MLRSITLVLSAASILSAANPFQPTIAPNGVVSAASYFTQAFPRYGIARGSMFIVFGSALGPVDLVQATSFPLPTTDGLAGTRVLISIGGYNATCPMVYSSINQIAAIMPSNAPEGDGSLVVSYQNLASTSVAIRVVRSAFGVFTRNQAGSGPAIAQNFVSQTSTPLNSLVNSAKPGQTMILWGSGLGPVTGDETAGPLPGALATLDALYVGGVQASVRYAGRSGCCAGIDQVIFDVPAGVNGCYVPVAAVTGGVVSNFGTISVASSGGVCDDPLGLRASAISTAQRNGTFRSGQINLMGQSSGEVDVTGTFTSVDLNTFLADAARVNLPAGSCGLFVSRNDLSAQRTGTGLNAGSAVTISGPVGNLTVINSSSGGYLTVQSPATLGPGTYTFTGTGGSDIGPFTASINLAPAAVWTNKSFFSVPALSPSNPLTFQWSSADPAGYVTVAISSANAIYTSEVRCNAASSAGAFTIPAWLASALYPSPLTVSLSSNSAPVSFTATGLDAGIIGASINTSVQTTMQPIVQ
jgi:uncharacterized protein (TIGR03437 family)